MLPVRLEQVLMTETKFAYGRDTIGGYSCPAVAAGYVPDIGDESIELAEWYDEEVRALGYGSAESIIPEEHAKEAWLSVIETMELPGNRLRYEERELKIAREIAEELGWL